MRIALWQSVVTSDNSLLCKYTSEEIWTAQLDYPCIGPLLRNKETSQPPPTLLNGTCEDRTATAVE